MAVKCIDKYIENFVTKSDIEAFIPKLEKAHSYLVNKNGEGSDFIGWYTLPFDYDKDEIERLKKCAAKIAAKSDILIVIGIGGSYLGARAAIEYLKSPYYNNLKKDTPDIYFIGNSISSDAINDLLSICEGKDIAVNVISKSGTTTEPGIAFRIFRNYLIDKYGEKEAYDRIVITTDKVKGALRAYANNVGCETFVIPSNIGGRYSVLTPCGLFPIAVAGIDVDRLFAGAKAAAEELSVCDYEKNDAYKYAVLRNALLAKGKVIEIMACYDPCFQYMNEWYKQLFGESEGKDNKGIMPDSVIYSTDLHSLGQIIQQGQRNIFETVINIGSVKTDIEVPFDEENLDGMNFLAGKKVSEVNEKAYMATLFAHMDGGVPNIVLSIGDRTEEDFGYMVYFFELACAVSGYILGVNPFNQPGVEAYKKNMFALLGKPGDEIEKIAKELSVKMSKYQ